MTLAKPVWQDSAMPRTVLHLAVRKTSTQYIITLLEYGLEAASSDFKEAHDNVVKQLNHELLRGTLPLFPKAPSALSEAYEKAEKSALDLDGIQGLLTPLGPYELEARWLALC